MLTKVTLGTYRRSVFKKTTQREFVFDSWTNIIGENATGKSTLLKLIASKRDPNELSYKGEYALSGVRRYPIAFELTFDKPTIVLQFRPMDLLSDGKSGELAIYGCNSLIRDLALDLSFNSPSGAESIADYMHYFMESNKHVWSQRDVDKCILFDEPETSMSLKTQKNTLGLWHSWVKQYNIQCICATHSLLPLTFGSCIELVPNYKKQQLNEYRKLITQLGG